MVQAVVVFGASGGIGSALSRRLGDRGMKLMVAGGSEDQTKSLAGELGVLSAVRRREYGCGQSCESGSDDSD